MMMFQEEKSRNIKMYVTLQEHNQEVRSEDGSRGQGGNIARLGAPLLPVITHCYLLVLFSFFLLVFLYWSGQGRYWDRYVTVFVITKNMLTILSSKLAKTATRAVPTMSCMSVRPFQVRI